MVNRQAKPEIFGGEKDILAPLLSLFPDFDRGFGYVRALFPARLVVVCDDDFKTLIETGTEVVTRIKLNALGTTNTLERKDHPDLSDWDRQGNLFVEELVPAEALFLAALRGAGDHAKLRTALAARPVIRVGGDETIGRGITHLTCLASKEG